MGGERNLFYKVFVTNIRTNKCISSFFNSDGKKSVLVGVTTFYKFFDENGCSNTVFTIGCIFNVTADGVFFFILSIGIENECDKNDREKKCFE